MTLTSRYHSPEFLGKTQGRPGVIRTFFENLAIQPAKVDAQYTILCDHPWNYSQDHNLLWIIEIYPEFSL